ncbi:major histocompatibility complex class I-related gene protein-like isoform X2 [Hemicordylus capensis]|uniref:major histocompatibility complex class I-related gene protein-like isoform X2 n=1 Tax=Hemicordylus capensis TaxID=884348 RepID=UPI00230383C9|nr:major histocompatibility complex class I-related gene protein-like isoform X2 [Hemicordylus capensis]
MGLLWWQLSVLGAAAFLLGHCTGSSTHSLGLFYTWFSEPSQGLPEFMAGQFVDDQPITYYDSSTKRVLARAQWMEKNDTQFWDLESKTMKSWEETFRALFVRLQNVSNQREGLHTWQGMLGCGLREDRKKWGYWRSGYDRRDFISFDTETNTWTVGDAVAEKMKRKWESLLTMSSNMKRYLEGPCIERLQTLVAYGNGSLLRKEIPVVKVIPKTASDGKESLICRAFGFYPKEIGITWRKNGTVWLQDVSHEGVFPNSDGTYHTWIKVLINPHEKNQYQCHVDPAGTSGQSLVEGFRAGGEEVPEERRWTIWDYFRYLLGGGEERPRDMAPRQMP